MFSFLPTIIFRHRKENLKKCTLQPLIDREGLWFLTYPKDSLPPLKNYVLLTLDAPVLTKKDKDCGIFLVDATWNYAEKMVKSIKEPMILRSLPNTLKTAYPRKQDDCTDPSRGLASIEALFAAYFILERDTTGLLDQYHWKDSFLEINKTLFT